MLKVFAAITICLCLQTLLTSAGDHRKPSIDAELAFRELGLESTVKLQEAMERYLAFRKELVDLAAATDSKYRPDIKDEIRKLDIAWKWIQHHYDPRKPAPVARVENPMGVQNPEIKTVRKIRPPMFVDTDKAFRILKLDPEMTKGEATKRYWKTLSALDEINNPDLAEAIEAKRKNLELAWEWIIHFYSPTDDNHPKQKLVFSEKMRDEYWRYHRRDDYTPPPRNINHVGSGEIIVDLEAVYRENGVEGVIQYLDPKRGAVEIRPIIDASKSTELLAAAGKSVQKWAVEANNEQRLILARALNALLTPYSNGRLEWFVPARNKSLADIYEHLEKVSKMLIPLHDAAVRNADTFEEYVKALKNISFGKNGLENLERSRNLLFEDGTKNLRVEKRFSKTLNELVYFLATDTEATSTPIFKDSERARGLAFFKNYGPLLGEIEYLPLPVSAERLPQVEQSSAYINALRDTYKMSESEDPGRQIKKHLKNAVVRSTGDLKAAQGTACDPQKNGPLRTLWSKLTGPKS